MMRTQERAAPMKGARTRKCSAKGCFGRYVPNAADPRVTWCSDDCAVTVALAAVAKRKAARAKAERANIAERKENIKGLREHIADAQTAFNAYIRERDKDLPCICCDRQPDEYSRGGLWDAGHYRSRGSAPHLRFDERNCHKQLKHCNRYASGRAADYRIGLIKRIGLEAVEALECDQAARKWTVEELQQIKATYRAKLAELKKGE